MTGTGTPSVVVFDVNETLSDLSGMAERFADVGAPGHLAALWFASVLRDGFALTAAGATPRFAELATGLLDAVLAPVELDRSRTRSRT
jgi:2-haloacid dehalogenase